MIQIFESDEFHELYKLDIKVEYSVMDADEGREFNSLPSDLVLEALGETVEEELLKNKKFICKDNQFKDFDLDFDTFNVRDNVLVFEVKTEFKIIGKYFTDKAASVLKNYKTIVYHDNREISVVVEEVSPMLRYLGSV